MKKSKQTPLDPWRDVRALLNPVNVTGGSCALLAMCAVALLSVCAAAFFIYRSFRGHGEEPTKATGEQRRKREKPDAPAESTGESLDEMRKTPCGDASSPLSTKTSLSPDVPETELNESALKELQEIADEILMELADKTDSEVDHSMETDPGEITENEDQVPLEEGDGEFEILAVTALECKLEDVVDKSEAGDERSETESTQDIIQQRSQDLKPSDHSSDSKPSESISEEETKMEDSGKRFEEHDDWRFPQMNNFDCCCEKISGQKNNPSWFHTCTKDASNRSSTITNRVDFQNYLGFQIDSAFINGCASQAKKLNEKDKTVRDEDEISIMDAIMDNNEWLNISAPEVNPLITPNEKRESQPNPACATDEDLANKRVATVSPLAQMVSVSFRIHYITHSPRQLLAVTGSLQDLGCWEGFVPLEKAKDGYWARSLVLPVESRLEWKFVLVEDGRISRWEECGNRLLFLTSQEEEELLLQESWGYC